MRKKDYVYLFIVLSLFSYNCKEGLSTSPNMPITKIITKPITIDFSVNPTSIMEGEKSTLSWKVENAETVTINNATVNFLESMDIFPVTDTSYNLVAKNVNEIKKAVCIVTIKNKAKLDISLNYLGESYPFRAIQEQGGLRRFMSGGSFNIEFLNTNNVSGKINRVFISCYTNTNIYLNDVEVISNNLQFSVNGKCSLYTSFCIEGFIKYFIIHAEIQDINNYFQNVTFRKDITWYGSYGY